MKIIFNPVSSINKFNLPTNQSKLYSYRQDREYCNAEYSALPNLSLANFPNVSFGHTECKSVLMKQAKNFRCAYSGMPMLTKEELEKIFKGLKKRHTSDSAVLYLQQYQKYMHRIENEVYTIFKNYSSKKETNFSKILKKLQPYALIRLKEKQLGIMHSTDKLISTMSEPVAQEIIKIKNLTLEKIKDDTFSRQATLEAVKKVKATGEDLSKVIKVYQAWYKLPSSYKDIDAFIVKYAKKSHNDIAKRLISSAEATIEHIVPTSRNGDDCLSNYILVSEAFNSVRHSMPLDEFIMLNDNIDVIVNLQKYMNDAIKEVNNPKSEFSKKNWYPEAIKKTVERETNNKIVLKTSKLKGSGVSKRKAQLPKQA